MFRLKTFGETIRPILLLNIVFGTGSIAPFKNRRANRIVEIVNLIVNIVMFVYLSIYVLCQNMDVLIPLKTYDFTIVVVSVLTVNGAVVMLVIVTKFKKKSMQDIINVMENIDDGMETIGLPKQHWSQCKYQMCNLLIFVGHFAMSAVTTWFFKIKPTAPTKQKILVTIILSIPYSMTMTVQLSFIIWIRYIRTKFRQVNQLLEEMIGALDYPRPGRFLEETNDRSIERRTTNWNDPREDLRKIMIAKKCHLDLIKVAKIVNKFYGFQLLLVTWIGLMILIMLLYVINFMIWNHLPIRDMLFEGFPTLLAIGIVWLRIVHLHNNCMHTSTEAKAAGFLLCRLYDSSTTAKFRAEVQNFTHQVLQTPLLFSVCGLVDFDRSFLTSLAGSIFTYLFVLVQLASTKWYLRQDFAGNATDRNVSLTVET